MSIRQYELHHSGASALPGVRTSLSELEHLSRLIGDIYDAALDSALWPDVVGKAGRFVGGLSATLVSKDAVNMSGNVLYESGGIPDHYRQTYLDTYAKMDPVTIGHFFAEIDQPIALSDLMPYDEFRATRFYQEWVEPQGLVDFISTTLDKSATSLALFGVFRHDRDGVADDAARRRMRLIAPHIRRAVLVSRIIDLKSAEAANLANALDGLSAGICLVDANGRLVHANAAGHAILAMDDFLYVAGGRLVARDAEVDQTLRKLFYAARDGDDAVGAQGIGLTLTASDGTRHVGHLLPLTVGARRAASVAHAATAALFVRKAELEMRSPPGIIAKTYNLTPTELRVLLAIVEVGGVPQVAAALGVAESTVKTHLGRLFEKMGVARQADLVRVVAGFSTMLAG